MNPVATAMVCVLSAAFIVIGAAKIAALNSMQTRASHLGFGVGSYCWIGILEVTGGLGLLIGWAVPGLGAAAAGGLVLLLCGAIFFHIRIGDTAKDTAPAILLAAAAVASLVLYTIEATS